jgi:hypothetical protein
VIASEAYLLRTLEAGAYTLDELYRLCESRADVDREHGRERIGDAFGADTRWRRRLRGALQQLKKSGGAERIERGVGPSRDPACARAPHAARGRRAR